jgi:uncharacterized protein YbgA (DUF1722 family)
MILQGALDEVPKRASRAGRREVLAALAAYRAGRAPRLVPLTLIRHVRSMAGLSDRDDPYLTPDPDELALRYGV